MGKLEMQMDVWSQ